MFLCFAGVDVLTLCYSPFLSPISIHRDIDRKFIEQYPNKRFLPKDVVVRLKEVVMHAHVGE